MQDPVVKAAQLAFSVRLKDSSDVSENTKNAQAIAKAWRGAVYGLDPDRFQIEAMVARAAYLLCLPVNLAFGQRVCRARSTSRRCPRLT